MGIKIGVVVHNRLTGESRHFRTLLAAQEWTGVDRKIIRAFMDINAEYCGMRFSPWEDHGNIPKPTRKKCSGCKDVKPVEEFNKNQSYCKACAKTKARERYYANLGRPVPAAREYHSKEHPAGTQTCCNCRKDKPYASFRPHVRKDGSRHYSKLCLSCDYAKRLQRRMGGDEDNSKPAQGRG